MNRYSPTYIATDMGYNAKVGYSTGGSYMNGGHYSQMYPDPAQGMMPVYPVYHFNRPQTMGVAAPHIFPYSTVGPVTTIPTVISKPPVMAPNTGPSDMSTAILIRVDQSGNGNFKTIQDAVYSIPSNNTELFFIWVKPGVYGETVIVPADKPYITISGSQASTTIITGSDGGEIFETAMFSVLADDFVGRFITIQGSMSNFMR